MGPHARTSRYFNSLGRALLIATMLTCVRDASAQRIITYDEAAPTVPLEYAVKNSDLIILGTIARSNVAVDHDIVWTEYTVETKRTLYQSVGRPPEGRMGAINTIVFRIGGGTGRLNGELITARDTNYPEQPFPIGAEYILLLKHYPELKCYALTGGPYSAFRIERGHVEPLKKNPHEQRLIQGVSAEAFAQTIRQLLPRR